MTSTLVNGRELLYKASAREPAIVRVPAMGFVMIDGRGDPNTSPDYVDAIQALYSLSYTLKFALKRDLGLQYRVSPLEGLWWGDDMTEFSEDRKDDWNWTMMIAQPDEVTKDRFDLARSDVGGKKDLPALPKARLEALRGGNRRSDPVRRAVQRRGSDDQASSRVHQRAGPCVRRDPSEAPRDLSERPSAKRPREVEDDHPSAVHRRMNREQARRLRSQPLSGGMPLAIRSTPKTTNSTAITAALCTASQLFNESSSDFACSPPTR